MNDSKSVLSVIGSCKMRGYYRVCLLYISGVVCCFTVAVGLFKGDLYEPTIWIKNTEIIVCLISCFGFIILLLGIFKKCIKEIKNELSSR